ncbi:MAG: type IV pilus modification protein PilV [Fluviicoccus sp.]|uniref:type IV pilus modification protein PilV n=1 Tax=Fluviicoccus sp. TaxID=2003552 RepID=UPI002725D1A0|nr:type IV pilus modification protein PilV [Fluviicoccus sp.]MDO8331476.1 type IV pilus modification protein PilV [Fluviicoccus sp.]
MFNQSRVHRQRGTTLIEVLVSMLLLAVAVIGFAALQVRALTTTNTAVYRAQAVGIAQELAEKMRANYSQLAAYRGANWDALPAQDCQAGVCTPAEMVSYDIRSSKMLAAAALPNGNVAARPCAAVNSLVCIYVSWNETTTANTGAVNACGATSGSYAGLAAECVIMEVY